MTPLVLQIFDDQRLVAEVELDARVELGRQKVESDPLYIRTPTDDRAVEWRINFAAFDEIAVSRNSLRLETLPSGLVRIKNLSSKNAPDVAGGGVIPYLASRDVQPPIHLTLANKTLRIKNDGSDVVLMKSLAEPTIAPGKLPMIRSSIIGSELSTGNDEVLITWFRAVTAVLQSATSSEEFFQQAAEALVDLVGLSSGRVLLYESGDWRTAATARDQEASHDGALPRPSPRILNSIRNEKRTFWQSSGPMASTASLLGIQAVVAAPILDRAGNVIGSLYGEREGEGSFLARSITQLEAMLVETLACSVAAGLARLGQEQAAMAAQVRFEQFFTPELTKHLTAQPDMLKGRDAEVTLLFCDVRDFSRISERLTPAVTVEWIGSVMSAMSDCVSAEHGVLVDYIGDELIAMWGAPATQPDHAQLACRAAAKMVHGLGRLNEQWQARLGEPIRVGIGINSGVARVGNTGSDRKFKYGPLGATVNLASRVQGATKYFRVELLVTSATRARLGDEFTARRLCKVRVLNISEPVDLYQLPVGNLENCQSMCTDYEAALHEFEGQSFRQAAGILSQLILKYPDDGPSLALLARTVNCLVNERMEFDPVWELPGK